MALFSERYKHKEIRESVQKESMDKALRNGLWNALDNSIYGKIKYGNSNFRDNHYKRLNDSSLRPLFFEYWDSYFKQPTDEIPEYFPKAKEILKNYFFACKWYEVYDLLELTANEAPEGLVISFKDSVNTVLTREGSAYRFVCNEIIEITSDEEIKSIEDAISGTSKIAGVNAHLKSSLNLFSDRQSPDYRNSVKESISAVEGICKLIANDEKATLGGALKVIKKNRTIEMHPALEKALLNLYGYASDTSRHGQPAMLEKESKIAFNEAKFMLVSCTAFINYLIGKVAEVGIELPDLN